MTDRERAICARVRQFREDIKWPQPAFANAVNISRNQLANVEYGRAPLRLNLAVNLCEAFGANGEWLATGKGLMHGGNPMLTMVKFGPEWYSQLFSETFDRNPDVFTKQIPPTTYLSSEPTPNFDPQTFLIKNILLWFQINKFKNPLEAENFARDICGHAESRLTELRSMGTAARNIRSEKGLRSSSLKSNNSSVKSEIEKLIEKIKRKALKPGAKADLAKTLGVAPARVSEWLAGKKEPGGEYTLRLLKWVESP
jgi:transcriptional regulator with XRE-family HTH domain